MIGQSGQTDFVAPVLATSSVDGGSNRGIHCGPPVVRLLCGRTTGLYMILRIVINGFFFALSCLYHQLKWVYDRREVSLGGMDSRIWIR